MQTFLFSAILGLCKLIQLPLPKRDKILDYSYVVFKQVDNDGSGEIEFEEFKDWVRNNDPI